MSTITDLINHIVTPHGSTFSPEQIVVGSHTLDYSRTKIGEHKFWTPRRVSGQTRCYLMIQFKGNNFILHHALDNSVFDKHSHNNSISFSSSQTVATACGSKDQFKGSIEVPKSFNGISNISTLTELIKFITNKTVEKCLHLSEKFRA